MPGLVGCVGRGHEVVLADGAVDTELAFSDIGADGSVGPVEFGEWTVVDGTASSAAGISVIRARDRASMGLSWWIGLALAPAVGAPFLAGPHWRSSSWPAASPWPPWRVH